jgi:radical SAM-linked protein
MSKTLTRSEAPPVDLRLLEDRVLPEVFKPGRYMGLEQGAARKPFEAAHATMCLAFPDLYEIGMSSYALKLLYSVVNRHPDYLCDRVYAPAKDFKAKLEEVGVPLYGVESKRPLTAFDMIAVSLQYELNYTTLFGILEAAGIPFRARDRKGGDWPILLGGGPGAAQPKPLAPFFDGFMVGDGEEILIEILDVLKQAKVDGLSREATLERLEGIEGLYIPGRTKRAYKRVVDIAGQQIDLYPLIPSVEAVHDRVVVEARRGCDRMCRFCQPSFINLPVREQNVEEIKRKALEELEKTGYEECSLLSLSIADYSHLKPLVMEVAAAVKDKNASLSLPSQRADRFNLEVAEAVQSVRKSTLTFAPEAGTPRLRDVINKNLSDAEILNAVTTAYRAGWNKVKLYFMIGLPTETETDLDGIVHIVQKVKAACELIKREPGASKVSHLEVNLTLSNFVPKPHTPFQWAPQDSREQLEQKIAYLREKFRKIKGVKVNYTSTALSKLEAVISRGDEELADVLEAAYRKGAYLDAWDENQNFELWFDTLAEFGLNPDAYTAERFTQLDEPLPWDDIDVGLSKDWLKEEYRRSLEAAATTPCFEACSTCGVCGTFGIWPSFTMIPEGLTDATYEQKAIIESREQLESLPEQMQKAPVVRMRLRLQKAGPLRFISHLDWVRLLHRAIARAKVPVAYSQGFNPKPKVSLGPALALFVESLGEYVDIDLTEPVGDLAGRLNPYLPPTGQVLEVTEIRLHGPSIDQSLVRMAYEARWTCADSEKEYNIGERVKVLICQSSWPIEVETKKARKSLDIAPYVSDLRLQNGAVSFVVQKYTNEAGQPVWIKPDWVLDLIAPDIHWNITRTGLHLVS